MGKLQQITPQRRVSHSFGDRPISVITWSTSSLFITLIGFKCSRTNAVSFPAVLFASPRTSRQTAQRAHRASDNFVCSTTGHAIRQPGRRMTRSQDLENGDRKSPRGYFAEMPTLPASLGESLGQVGGDGFCPTEASDYLPEMRIVLGLRVDSVLRLIALQIYK